MKLNINRGLNKQSLTTCIGIIAVISPLLHSIGDVIKLIDNGLLSVPQLILTYASFMLLPLMIVGIFALYWQKLGWIGFMGAILYSVAFTYFATTAMNPLVHMLSEVTSGNLNFNELSDLLGFPYLFHGILMILGGLLFGGAILLSNTLPKLTGILLIIGVLANAIFSLVPIGPFFIVGALIRNASFILMGFYLLKNKEALY